MRDRTRFASDLVEAALARRGDSGTLVVGVTGMVGSGLRELGELLVESLSLRGETPVLVSLRDFMWPEEEWLPAQREEEAQAYYSSAFALELLVTSLLEPARAGVPVDLSGHGADGDWTVLVDPGDIIVLCGPFLMRSDLRRLVDYVISVEPDRQRSMRVAAARGEDPDVVGRRYLPAEHLHAATHPPVEHADVVVDISKPSAPAVLWKREGSR